jgi:hypothetical protein
MATRRKFTLEFKTEAAHRVIDSGRSVVEVAKEIAVPDNSSAPPRGPNYCACVARSTSRRKT